MTQNHKSFVILFSFRTKVQDVHLINGTILSADLALLRGQDFKMSVSMPSNGENRCC
ncbi:MAG TPA: hypothetical protein PKW80_11895 [Bacteroidales bacterium]|nr:hypothetical protein [Bacteroidales bacterium]